MSKHKCEGCIHKGQHQEMGFKPFGVCKLESNLIDAEKNYNAEKCPYKKPMTNADRIRNMSDEELAEFLVYTQSTIKNCMIGIEDCKHENTDKDCKDCFIEWLQA